MSTLIFSIFIFITFIISFNCAQNLNISLSMLKNDQMHWNDIVHSEDFIIKALEKLKSDLHITTTTKRVDDTITKLANTTIATEYLTEKLTTTERSIPTIPTTKKIRSKTNRSKKTRNVLEILLNGTAEELKSASRRNVVKVLPKLQNIKVPIDKKLILWEIYKNKMAAVELTITHLQEAESLFDTIPEDDLYNLNLSDNDILYYLGTLHGMSRRRAAILGYALKNNLQINSSEILQSSMINAMRGILCGFPTYDLSTINSTEIWTMNEDVLNNLWACSKDQLNVLFQVFAQNFKIGHVELWNEEIVKKLGFLLQVVKPFDMKLIAGNLFEFMPGYVFGLLGSEQLNALTSEQVKQLNEEHLIVYNSKIR